MAGLLGKALLAATQPLKPLMPRMRPALIIIGAQKAGTTTLFDLLSLHPRIIPPMEKEVSFFNSDQRYGEGMSRYYKRFPKKPVAPGPMITLEASPDYFYSPTAAERITKHLPDVLCAAVLRDPVARTYSAWNMYAQFKDHQRYAHLHDPRSFAEAVEEELAGKLDIPARRYVANSVYAPQLARFVNHLGRDRVQVYGFKDLVRDPQTLVNDLLRRMGLPALPSDHPAFRTWSNRRAYTTNLDPQLVQKLRAVFAPDQQSLRALLGELPDYLDPPE
jgi:hypothetical protein